jgi:hypothetical protein
MANDINTLRAALFDTLRRLQSKDDPIDLDQAKAINETAQTLVNTVKAEIEFMRVAGGTRGTDFIPALSPEKPAPEDTRAPAPAGPAVRLTQHGKETLTPIPGGVVHRHVLR